MSCNKNKNECTPPRCKWIVGTGCRVNRDSPLQRISPACGTRRKASCTPPCKWINSKCRSPAYISPNPEEEEKRIANSPCDKRKLKRNCTPPCEWIVGVGCRSPPGPNEDVSSISALTASIASQTSLSFTESDRSLLEPSVNGDFQVVLKDVQQRAVDHMRTHDELLIVFGTGMGKTITAVTIALNYLTENPTRKVVVLSPKSLLNNFANELARHYGITDESRIEYFTYGQFHRKMEKSPRFCNNKLLIIDEVHNFRNPKGKQLLSTLKCSSKCAKRVLLTATPFVNSAKDLNSLYALLTGQKAVGGGTIPSLFENKVIFAPKVNDPRFFPTFTEHQIGIDMSDREEERLKLELGRAYHDPEVFFHGFRRVVNGVKEGHAYLSSKIPFILQTMLADRTKKNLIYSNWLEHGIHIVEKELQRNQVPFVSISGADSTKHRNEAVARFNSGEANTLVISNAGSEGLDLKAVENVFVIDPPWNPAGVDQVIGRAIRYNSHDGMPPNRRHVDIYYLILRQRDLRSGDKPISGDVLLYNIIDRKRRIQDEILNEFYRISI